MQEFGVDTLRDLARVAGGTPRNVKFASFVAGKDSLSITCKIEPDKIHKKCAEIITMYKQTTYRDEYAWVDNMRKVEEKVTIEKLDEKIGEAIDKLRSEKHSDLHMTPPEIVHYTEGSTLHYNGFGSHGTSFQSLSIKDYVNELNRCGFKGDIFEIKQKHRVKAKDGDEDEFSEKWRVYNCFVYEATLGPEASEEHYVLFAGEWYKVEKSFKKRIEDAFDVIETVEIVGKTTCRNEQELIADLEKKRTDLVKLDGEKINPEDVRYANLEPCDFFSDKKDFIHLKDGHSSGPISHLWFQGVVSADAFISDKKFRKELRAKVQKKKPGFESYLPASGKEVARGDYRVVYGIMRKPYVGGKVGLPFFSKVSLQAAVESLNRFGIKVAIELIEKPASDTKKEEEIEEGA